MLVKYADFLSVLKERFDVRCLKDYDKEALTSVCLLRHDIDRYMGRALLMARIERSFDIQSTYFLLSGTEYYKNKMFIKDCKRLQNMGHEIGLHNNFLTRAMRSKRDPRIILEKELDYLRDNGIQIFGTSAHGDSACRQFKFTNYEIFEGCTPSYRKKRRKFRGIKLHTLDMVDYGLYEAYFLPRDFYITDCRNTWRYIEGEGDEWNPKFQPHSPKIGNILDFLQEISLGKVMLQALLHPNLKLIDIKKEE